MALGEHVLLLTYDLNQDGHEYLRRDWTSTWGDEGGSRWVRVQRSVLLVRSERSAQEFCDVFYAGAWTAPGRLFAIDILDAPYSGRGDKRAWDWLESARSGARAERDARLRVQNDAWMRDQDAKFVGRLAEGWPTTPIRLRDAIRLEHNLATERRGSLDAWMTGLLDEQLPGWREREEVARAADNG
ncbi:hypothetical protein GCM10025867_51310 (plasmid) [Frondihabitans sucicola]|uniref:Uncharacterized protein n=1 Tax=Frondihabitans sucicola TaxID=1268041 RepID=A0ABM8GV35_9MICO|nr:hypothetical protein [Frondihabitans sucicola]BDZ52323.1 hypothetical protein GCM10025867_45640 [Frondihabitans sucicola]BDZ52890.1 hypothetical protein GCM10025867_51310 [Frondihabitans sucicola]